LGQGWGRNYVDDLAHHDNLRDALTRDYGAILGPMGIDINTRLRQAFEGGAHAAGSDPVRAALDRAAQDIRDEVAALVM